MDDFSSLLRRLRERAGHRSARDFYRVAGGRPAFGCTYKQYLNIEAGRSTPRPRVVSALVAVLRLWQDPETARRFARAYLGSLLGGGEACDFLLRSLESPRKDAPPGPLKRAVERDWESRAKPLTGAQSRLIRRDDATYWAFTLLESDSGSLSAQEMSEVLSIPARPLSAALEDLLRARLVVRDPDGRYRCPDAGRIFIHERPPGQAEVAAHLTELRRRWSAMGRRHGKVLFDQYLFLRASEAELRTHLPTLAQAVSDAEIYASVERGEDTSFVLVESTVKRVMPF